MAEVIYWLGDADVNSARVCLRTDTTGVYNIVCNGVTKTASLDTTINYGVGYVDFTGLSVNTAYSFSILLGGILQASGTLRTAPSTNDSFYIGAGSCFNNAADPIVLYTLVNKYNIRAFFSLGDMPYCDEATGSGGVSRFAQANYAGTYTAPTDINTWHQQFLYLHRDIPAHRYLAERVPTYKMWDDHELSNDWDHKFANVNTNFTANGGIAFVAQSDVDTFFNLGRQAWEVWACGNPSNTSPLKVATKPANAAAGTSTSNYPGEYFYKDIGPARWIVPDYITHRAGTDDADDETYIENSSTAKTMLGLAQIRWFKNAILSSPYSFNPVMSTKLWYNPYNSNNHGMNDCVTERDSLIAWLSKSGRGTVFSGGDAHTACVVNSNRFAQVNPGAIGQAEQDGSSAPDFLAGYQQEVVWKSGGYDAGDTDVMRAALVIYVTPDYLDWIIVDDTGVERTRWRQYKKQNTLVQIN